MLAARSRKPITLIAVFPLVLLLVFAIYLFMWRPSDDNIKTALVDVSSLQKNTTQSMPYAFEFLSNPSSINPEIATSFKLKAAEYTAVLDSLSKSSAIQHSMSTSSIFNTYKSDLFSYGQFLKSLAGSVSDYGDILSACNSLAEKVGTISSKADFNKIAEACNKAIASADSSANNDFNNKFFSDYLQKSKDVMTATEQYFGALDTQRLADVNIAMDALSNANAKIKKASSVTINYDHPAPSSDIFSKLAVALNEQRDSLIR